MLHAQAVANGLDFDWENAGDASEEIKQEYERLADIDVENLI